MIDGNGNRATLRYDGHGRQDRWTFPSATRPSAYNDPTQATALASAGSLNAADYEAYEYDPNGNRRFLTKRDGSQLEYQYDALNRLTVKIVPERPAGPQALTAAQTRDVHYGYDLRNLQLSARFDSASGEGVTNSYDGFGRMVSSSINMGGVTRTLTYAYDANSNRTRITHPDGPWFDLLHDGLDRPIYLSRTSSFGLMFTSYLPHGLPSGTSRGNDSLSPYDYDGIQQLNYLGHWFPGSAANGLWLYARNPAGQIASIFSYTDAYAWTGHYAVNRNYTTDGLNRYTAAGPATFVYDPNGNLTSDGTRTYIYDIENRLVGSGNLTLAYDPLGRLFQTSGPGLATTRFLYDGDALVAEYDGAGLMTRRYVHWAGADVPVASYAGSGLAQPSYLYADHQGSIVAVANANGQTIQPNAYDEYGVPAAANVGRFQYTGQAWLPELGMYHYKARIYSPTLGRFMQTDPIGYEGGINLYAYVGNDATNLRDPSGNQPPEGGATDRLRQEALREIGSDIYQSETKADDAALFGAVGLMAAGPLGVIAGSQISTFVLGNALTLTEGAAIGAEAIAPGAGGVAALGVVRPFQSGTAAELRAGSQTADGLDVHHAPQSHVAAQVSPGYSARTGPAIALPYREHRAMPRLQGRVNMTPRQMLARETRNLRNFTTATREQIGSWLSLAKQYFGID